MCDSNDVGKVIAGSLHDQGRMAKEVFAKQADIIPPESVQPEKCAFSGEWLSKEDREPVGAYTKRHLKERVYQAIIQRPDKSCCAMCGEPLPDWKQVQAHQSPREIHNNFCDPCRDYFCLMAAVVHGDEKALAVMHGQRPAIAYEPMQTVDDIIDMQPVQRREPAYVRR